MLSRLEISQSDFDELTAFIKEKYGLDLARKKSIVESRLSNYVLDCGFNRQRNCQPYKPPYYQPYIFHA